MPSLRLKRQSPETRTFEFANSGLRPFAGLLIVVATFLMWVNAAHSQVPNRYVADGALHLGEVKQGEVVERRFQFRNPERSPLNVRIEDLSHPGMKIRMPAELASESTGWITVSWDTKTVQGETTAEILLRFNETDIVPLSLTARVVPAIEILPYPAVFISGFRDEKTSRTIELVNHDKAPLNIVGLSRENAELLESYSAGFTTLEPGRRYRLNVELKPAERAGRSADVMKVLTDHPRFPVIRIPVNVLIKDDVYINPESVDFGPITGQAFSPESFLLKARTRPIKVLSVSSDLPFLKVTPSTVDTSALTHEFQVGIEGKVVRGPFKGTISIRTDNPDFPELKATVEGSVQ